MRTPLAPVAALLFSVALLLMGNGLQNTLIPVRAHLETFSTPDIGVLGSFYFAGFAAGCLFGPLLVRRAGHIRSFAAMVSLASTIVLAHALLPDVIVWWLLRAVTGFCFAALYMIIESWLNERATNETRGTIFSIYTIINLSVLTLGQLMITLYDPAAFPLFALASILVSVAAIPVALTAAKAPAPITHVTVRPWRIFKFSPVGFVGCLAVGAANGSLWSLGPVFAQQNGMAVHELAIFMSIIAIAGAIGQWPLGRLSDAVDRRKVILGACLAASLAGLGLVGITGLGTLTIMGAGFVYGLCALPLYGLSVAHTNDFASPDDFVEIASGLLLIYALGAIVGPVVASTAMTTIGPEGLFAFTAVIHASLAVFALARMSIRERAPEEERVDFSDALLSAQTISPINPFPESSEADKKEQRVPEQEGSEEDLQGLGEEPSDAANPSSESLSEDKAGEEDSATSSKTDEPAPLTDATETNGKVKPDDPRKES
ncbi:MFS transporter [Rhodovibrionaceae bacterium A322]